MTRTPDRAALPKSVSSSRAAINTTAKSTRQTSVANLGQRPRERPIYPRPMKFAPDIAGLYATANLLPSPAVEALVERLIDLLDRRAGDPDFEPGDMEPDNEV